jgi:hypothetical protein
MRFPEHDDVIETFSSHAPDHPLHIRSLPGAVRRNDLLLGIHRETVRSEMLMPSFRSSPCTRGAPHRMLAFAILRMSSRISRSFPGRPGRLLRDRRVQYAANLFRCQRTTVSGFTMTNVSLQRDQARDKSSQKTRSALRSLGRGCCRFMIASCWRRARFSRARLERSRKAARTSASRRRIINIMAGSVGLGGLESQAFQNGRDFGE